jgi:hypothetical protein
VLSKDEAKFVFERGCKQVIPGSGQMGNVHLSPEAEAYFVKKGCKILLQPTPVAIGAFNRSHAKKIGLFHVTLLKRGVPTSRARQQEDRSGAGQDRANAGAHRRAFSYFGWADAKRPLLLASTGRIRTYTRSRTK